jgi:transposase
MNCHKNARTTPYGRALMVRRVGELGWSAARAAEAAGVSVRTVRKWLARHRAEGPAGLLDRSSRPRRSRPRIAAGWQTLIMRLRQCRMAAAEIAGRLHLARSTVPAELVRLA